MFNNLLLEEQMANGLLSCMRTLKEMMEDRGHDASAMSGLSDKEVDVLIAGGSFLLLPCKGHACIVLTQAKLSANTLRSDIKRHMASVPVDVYFLILLVNDMPSNVEPQLAKLKLDYDQLKYVQLFTVSELAFNPSRHVLVPKHEVLSDIEAENVMKTYRLKNRHQLPVIFAKDPMAKYLGVQSGQIVRITRQSQSCGEHVAYRICV